MRLENATLIYLSYGAGPHVDEICYSIMTAFRFLPADNPQIEYVIYTDMPKLFTHLGVKLRPISPEEHAEWLGGSDYMHRIKTMVIEDALETFGGSVIFVDSDTFFKKSPLLLFDRVGPGRSCFHVMEAHLNESKTPMDWQLLQGLAGGDIYDSRGEVMPLSERDPMWNSGVLGVHADDIDRFRDIPVMIDQLWQRVRVNHIEQYAAGMALRDTKMAECRDVVFHYWPPYLKPEFRDKLPAILKAAYKLPAEKRGEYAYSQRLRPTAKQVLKVTVREWARRIGLPVSGLLKNA